MVKALNGLPLIIRTLDIGGDKAVPYMAMPAEENPFLGERGIRLCLNRPELFRTQLRAIFRAAAEGPVRIMFPMISTLEELKRAKALTEEVRLALGADPVEIGIMIEVPSAVMMAEELAAEVDFFSVGSNDLTQYTLAMDRMHPILSRQADGLHPAVLRMIDRTVRAADGAGKWVGVCGGIAGDPAGVVILTGLGVRELSVSIPEHRGGQGPDPRPLHGAGPGSRPARAGLHERRSRAAPALTEEIAMNDTKGIIATLSLNPAIDQTARVRGFTAGRVNRVEWEQSDAGGKGVNVASFLADAGLPVAATGLLGEENVESFVALFTRKGIADRFVHLPGRTRVNVKIVDPMLNQVTDINFPGLSPRPEDIGQLIEGIDRLCAMADLLRAVRQRAGGSPREHLRGSGEPSEVTRQAGRPGCERPALRRGGQVRARM